MGHSPAYRLLLKNEIFLSMLSWLQVGLPLEGQKHPPESSQNPWHHWTESIRK